MKSLWEADARSELLDRLSRLTPAHRAKWGRLNAEQMLVHLADSMRMALGELKAKSRKMPLRYPPLKQLIIYVLPFPRSAPTAPELLARQPGEWGQEMTLLADLIERFHARPCEGPWPDHPAFGVMSGRAWGVLGYRHIDHHLRQFGV
jgi:hypothetical protein